MLSVRVWRSSLGDYEEFEVPRSDHQTILDVVSWIQRHLDSTLSYRFSCRVGMCGSCAMTVNGSPRWTCRTRVDAVTSNNELEISPLRNFGVVKDLVSDMDDFFAKWTSVGVFDGGDKTREDSPVRVLPDSVSRRLVDSSIECINCGICYAACDTVTSNDEFLGPAALNRLWTLVSDERDVADRADDSSSCVHCHSLGLCSSSCPVGLNPTDSISHLKRGVASKWLRGS